MAVKFPCLESRHGSNPRVSPQHPRNLTHNLAQTHCKQITGLSTTDIDKCEKSCDDSDFVIEVGFTADSNNEYNSTAKIVTAGLVDQSAKLGCKPQNFGTYFLFFE